MKKLLTIVTVLIMFLVGCSNEENNITGPTTDAGTQLSKGDKSLANLKLIRLTSDLVPILLATVTKVIDGSIGGTITLQQNVLSSEGQLVEVKSDFQVAAGAFEGKKNITIIVDVDSGFISFYPHMNFNKTCYLNFGLQNVNLANLGFQPNDKKADFVYFDDNGTIDPIASMGVNLIYNKGNVQVQKGQINHFSRYGFVRKGD